MKKHLIRLLLHNERIVHEDKKLSLDYVQVKSHWIKKNIIDFLRYKICKIRAKVLDHIANRTYVVEWAYKS